MRSDGRAFDFGQVFEVQVAHLRGGVQDGARDAGFLGGWVKLRDGVAALTGEPNAAYRHEADGEAVHAVADVGARAIGAEDVAGEVVVACARAAAKPEDSISNSRLRIPTIMPIQLPD